MPKQRITKEMILEAAFHIAQEQGITNVLVKNVSTRLGCSVQPIYSYYKNMDELRQDLVEHTKEYFQAYLSQSIDPAGPIFRQTGACYLRFAKEQPHLFQLLFLRKRPGLSSLQELYETECNPQIAQYLANTLNLSLHSAKELQLHRGFYTMGISAILATSQCEISTDELMEQMESAYQCFFNQAQQEETK